MEHCSSKISVPSAFINSDTHYHINLLTLQNSTPLAHPTLPQIINRACQWQHMPDVLVALPGDEQSQNGVIIITPKSQIKQTFLPLFKLLLKQPPAPATPGGLQQEPTVKRESCLL